MKASFDGDLNAVLAHIDETIGASTNWTEWPGGWRDDIESALIDAVFSARAVYKSKHGRGVHSLVLTWQQKRTRTPYTLSALSAEIDAVGPEAWAQAFGSMQRSPSRHPDSPGGPTKAAAVREAAAALAQANIESAKDINTENAEKVKTVLRGVDGIGYATSNYFLMLLGAPGVKPDRMIHRFLRDATGRQLTDKYADQILTAAAEELLHRSRFSWTPSRQGEDACHGGEQRKPAGVVWRLPVSAQVVGGQEDGGGAAAAPR